MRNYLYIGALALPLAIANQSGYRMNCEVYGLQCHNYPEHPHTPEEHHASVGIGTNTDTHTVTGSGRDIIGSGQLFAGDSVMSGVPPPSVAL